MCIHWVCSSCFSMITHIYNNILLNLNYLWDYNTLDLCYQHRKNQGVQQIGIIIKNDKKNEKKEVIKKKK